MAVDRGVARHQHRHGPACRGVRGRRTLWRLQVTARSFLGAMALQTGGIVADHGWFRLYGGGSRDLPDLATVNGLGDPATTSTSPGAMLIGHDAVGGRLFPLPATVEGQDKGTLSRRPVPIRELFELY
ncbi:MAG: DUF2625 family protein [Propionibacterium sp.]|nr:DUF2625 family protein [Propionibacterium sp.]